MNFILWLTSLAAPSWSWASVNGPIEFESASSYIDRKSRYTAVIIDCRVDLLVPHDPLGLVTGAQLRLRADMAHISPQQIAANPSWILTLDGNEASNPSWILTWDGNESSMRVVTYYLCVFTTHASWCNDLYLLVLEPTGAKSNEFRRVGLLSIHLGRNTPVEDLKVFPDCTFTIV